MYRQSMFAALWLLLSGLQSAQTQTPDSCNITLSGIIRDSHDQSILDYSTIYMLETDQGTAADENGEFVIEGLCPGTITLRYSHIGCETRDTVIEVRRNMYLELYLEHHAELLELIEVATVGLKGQASQSEVSIEGNALSLAQGRSLARSMEQLSGISILQTGPNVLKPVLHGMHSSRLLIMQNGIEQESQDWGLDHAPEIDPFFGERITVVKGAGAVQYGTDAMSGVILVDQQRLKTLTPLNGAARILGSTNGRSLGTSLDLRQGGEKLAWRTHLTGRVSGDFMAPDYYLTNTSLKEGSLAIAGAYFYNRGQMELSYSLFNAENGILRAAHIGNLTDLELALHSDRPLIVEEFDYNIEQPKQTVLHHIAQLNADLETGIGSIDGRYAVQWNRRKEFDIRRGDRDDKPSLDLSLVTHHAELVLNHRLLFDRLKGRAGISWKYQNNENVPGTGISPLIPDYTLLSPAIFLTEQWSTTRWTFELGTRYAYQKLKVRRFDENNILRKPEFSFHTTAATAGMVYRPAEGLRLSTNLGLSMRAPNVHELYSEGLHHGAAAIEEGDDELDREQALKWMQTIEWEYNPIELEVTTYQQWFNDYIYLEPGDEPRLTIRGAFPVFYYTQTDAFLWGSDVQAQVRLGKAFTIQSIYSFVRAEERNSEDGTPLPGLPADRMQHSLKFYPAQQIPGERRFQAYLRYEYVWKQKRIPEGSDFTDPPNAFGLFHVGASTQWPVGEKTLLTSISVRNVFNTEYREYLNRLRYFAAEPGRSVEILLSYMF